MRLIDADLLSEAIHENVPAPYDDASWAKDNCLAEVEMAPTVDAVPVVRCRECKHRGTDDCIFHIKGEPADEELLLKLDNDFCSYGERKEGADNDT